MSFILNGLTVAGLMYLMYAFVRKSTITLHVRDPFLSPVHFEKDPVWGSTPDTDHPPPARRIPQSPPPLIEPDIIREH